MSNRWDQRRTRYIAVCLRETEVCAYGSVVSGRVGEAGSSVEGACLDPLDLRLCVADGVSGIDQHPQAGRHGQDSGSDALDHLVEDGGGPGALADQVADQVTGSGLEEARAHVLREVLKELPQPQAADGRQPDQGVLERSRVGPEQVRGRA